MSEYPAAKPKPGVLTWALRGVALLGVAAVVYIIAQASNNKSPDTPAAPAAASTASGPSAFTAKLIKPSVPTPAPAYEIRDAQDRPLTLADLKGKVVVMNLWATWCAPCKIEMPTLAKFQAAYAGKPVEVVTVSIDSEDKIAEAKLFIASHPPLKFYRDPGSKLPWALTPAAAGIPTTVIYGPDGMERARLAGEADWSAPEAHKLVDAILAE